MSDPTDSLLPDSTHPDSATAVHNVMHRYALAIDTKDWDALGDVFADEVVADFRSFGAKEVYRGAGSGWVKQVSATISGMDATQHLMGNHLYRISDDRAVGTTYIQARHVCRNDWGGDVYTVGGHYDVQMARVGGEWRISEYVINCTWHEGDRHVLKAANRNRTS
ncbi:MAG: nuclear transport factor 2 family protein [Actinomycetota bacterium]|nr:nuclear transport factor 2 family protein [Actinomycetota bacterium]